VGLYPQLRPPGRALGRILTFAVVAAFPATPSVANCLAGIAGAPADTDYRLMVRRIPSAAQAGNRFEALPGRSEADGILVVSPAPTPQERALLAGWQVPIVFVEADEDPPAEPHQSPADALAAGRDATGRLIELTMSRSVSSERPATTPPIRSIPANSVFIPSARPQYCVLSIRGVRFLYVFGFLAVLLLHLAGLMRAQEAQPGTDARPEESVGSAVTSQVSPSPPPGPLRQVAKDWVVHVLSALADKVVIVRIAPSRRPDRTSAATMPWRDTARRQPPAHRRRS
jgi:hypothetical protein